ncbi:MAG: hypothetical protein Q8Q23_02055 [bacterium]|nr:hypothetical protein [bacterium]
MKSNIFIITAAGGNATAIEITPAELDHVEYSRQGKKLMARTQQYGVEQCGFLIPEANHFEMSGGEFCGNAARAASILFSQLNGSPNVTFSMSGLAGTVTGTVKRKRDNVYDVTCVFQGMEIIQRKVWIEGKPAELVDLGGIVHVVLESAFPADYEAQHRRIVQKLHLSEKDAVGVCWVERKNRSVTIHPVVWVRGIDSFFYESSCGSGSIAAGKTQNVSSVIQPTGQSIEVEFSESTITLHSEMEVTHEYEW